MNRRYLLGGLAAVAAAVGWAGLGLGAKPANLLLDSPSGAALAADPDTLLVDIRRPEEWRDTGVIEGALLVTYSDPQSFLAAVRPHLAPGQRLALICRSGNRTSRAARELAPLVDHAVVDIAGGMLRIRAEGYAPVAPTRAQGCQVC